MNQPDMFHAAPSPNSLNRSEKSDPVVTIGAARAARDEGMQRAVDHAEIESPDWAQHAYEWLELFVAAHAEPFISEDVSDASKLDSSFPQPPTDRAWGSIYRSAVKRGLIRLAGTGRSRRRHASICPLWIRA